MKKLKTKDMIYYVLMFVFAAVFLVSGFMLAKNYITNKKHDDDFKSLASAFPEEAQPELSMDVLNSVIGAGSANGAAAGEGTGSGGNSNGKTGSNEPGAAESAGDNKEAADKEEAFWSQVEPVEWKQYWEHVAGNRFDTYESLKAQNSDFVGWVRIEGTKVDYPVVQSTYEADFYLRRDFNKNYSYNGIPYMMELCKPEEGGTNLLIYGHHMKNGSMFAALQNYTSKSYYNRHPYVQFDTIDQAGTYQIVGTIKIDAAGDQSVWQQLLFPRSLDEFDQAWARFQQQSFYSTGISIAPEDRLLALVTCEYTLKDGRLMVLARKLQ